MPSGTDLRNEVSFDHQGGSARGGCTGCGVGGAHAYVARHATKTRSEIEPGIGRGKAGYGPAGQAFALVESGVVDRATANSSPRTAAGHKQDDQTAKSKPPQEAARGFWIRAWGQREPALQGTGRSNDPARLLGSLEGGLDDPRHSRQNQLTSHRTPDPDVEDPPLAG